LWPNSFSPASLKKLTMPMPALLCDGPRLRRLKPILRAAA
jgi:hypothetical protein